MTLFILIIIIIILIYEKHKKSRQNAFMETYDHYHRPELHIRYINVYPEPCRESVKFEMACVYKDIACCRYPSIQSKSFRC